MSRSSELLADGMREFLDRTDSPLAEAAGQYVAGILLLHESWLKSHKTQ